MQGKFYRNAKRLALKAGLVAARAGTWATKEGHALCTKAQMRLEELTRAAERAEAAQHPHGFGAESPAVPPAESVGEGYLVCLDCGKRFKSLHRHLKSAHGLTPEAYREKWGLPADYLMTAPAAPEKGSAGPAAAQPA